MPYTKAARTAGRDKSEESTSLSMNVYKVRWTHVSQFSKRHLDRFSCFCTAHPYDQHTVTQTHRPRYVQRSSKAIGRVYALRMHEIRPKTLTYLEHIY